MTRDPHTQESLSKLHACECDRPCGHSCLIMPCHPKAAAYPVYMHADGVLLLVCSICKTPGPAIAVAGTH